MSVKAADGSDAGDPCGSHLKQLELESFGANPSSTSCYLYSLGQVN